MAWLTPQDSPTDYSSRAILLPIGQEYESLFIGLLMMFIDSANFEQFGDVTPDELADIFRVTFNDFLDDIT
jgi:hypothetical protein